MDRFSNLPDYIIYHILSLMDTKDAVRTCVLSKNWRYHWTNIHSLNFTCRSFLCFIDFYGFVTHVLDHRKDSNLVKLKFYCNDDICAKLKTQLVRSVFEYAISHKFEELETDLDSETDIGGSFPSIPCFGTLTTLQLSSVIINPKLSLFPLFFNLENLLLIQCSMSQDLVPPVEVYTISSPRLINLVITDFNYGGRIVLNVPRLKFLHLNGIYPSMWSMHEGMTLDEVHIDMLTPSTTSRDAGDDMMSESETGDIALMREYVFRMTPICGELRHVKSLTLSFPLTKGKSLVYHDIVDGDETTMMELYMVTGERKLSFALPKIQEFTVCQLGTTIIKDIVLEKPSSPSSETESSGLIALVLLCVFTLQSRKLAFLK